MQTPVPCTRKSHHRNLTPMTQRTDSQRGRLRAVCDEGLQAHRLPCGAGLCSVQTPRDSEHPHQHGIQPRLQLGSLSASGRDAGEAPAGLTLSFGGARNRITTTPVLRPPHWCRHRSFWAGRKPQPLLESGMGLSRQTSRFSPSACSCHLQS